MTKTAEWIHKVADWGHGDTLEGQLMRRTLDGLAKRVADLRARAAANELGDVLPRWRGEIRRAILMLPTTERLARLSMMELEGLEKRVDEIASSMRRYTARTGGQGANTAKS
jgi:hypothetical protein